MGIVHKAPVEHPRGKACMGLSKPKNKLTTFSPEMLSSKSVLWNTEICTQKSDRQTVVVQIRVFHTYFVKKEMIHYKEIG